jgi:hypothetical protein
MPGFDGTGPRSRGPMTGRGSGFCVVRIRDTAIAQPAGTVGRAAQPRCGEPAAMTPDGGSLRLQIFWIARAARSIKRRLACLDVNRPRGETR